MGEISYRRGHQYLTVIADHDTGRVVWVVDLELAAVAELLALEVDQSLGVDLP
jgi:hypothetical protein